MLARFATENDHGDSAHVAVWNVELVTDNGDIDIDAVNEYDSYYTFTVATDGTEVSSSYGLNVSLSKDGDDTWPAYVTAQLTNADGTEVIKTSTDGDFSELGSFAPGVTDSVEYRLYIKADYPVITGEYDMNISAYIEQVD